MNEITQSIIEKVKCPYKVFSYECSADEVRNAYNEALERGRKEGFWPLLVESDDTLEDWLDILENEEGYNKDEAISNVTGRGKEILKKRYEEYIEDWQNDTDEQEQDEWTGTMEGGETIGELSAFLDYEGGINETILFEIPVKNPWEVIAWLPMGGWNECPDPEEMMEICRYWYEAYGAVPSVVSHDELEFYVGKEMDEEKAWELAKEHYAFSPDRVDQCTLSETLGELADCIHKSKVWYFWWD